MSRTASSVSGYNIADSEPSKSSAVGHSKGKVLYEQSITLWSPHDGCSDRANQQYGDLGDFESGFQIVIPTQAIYQGAKSTMIFKKWRIWWAVEAVISHKPSGMHGDRIVKSQQLALLNYSSAVGTSPLQWSSSFDSSSAPEYTISGNTAFLGSSDPLSLSVRVRRNNQSESPKKVTVELRREIVYNHSDSPSTSHGFDSKATNGRRISNFMSNRRTRSNSRRDSDHTPYEPPTPPAYIPTPLEYQESAVDSYFGLFGPAPTTETTRHQSFGQSPRGSAATARRKREDIALATFEADFRPEGSETYSCQVKGDLPKARSLYHYALGESCTTTQGSSRFYLVLRLHYRSKNNVVELPHRTITFTTVSSDERQKATQQLSRIAAIQGAEAKLFRSIGKVSKFCADEGQGERAVKLSTVRRRSEQLDVQTASPRTRLRFGSDPSDLSPIVSSILHSPSLSIASIATHRPRGASKKQAASIHSNRNLRPHSSGGLSTASSSRSLASISPNPQARNSSGPVQKIDFFNVSPFLSYSPSLHKAEEDEEMENRPPKQPPIDFNSFTLRPPPGRLQGNTAKEEAVPPKGGVRSRTRSAKASSHRSVANVLPPSGPSHSAPALLELNDKLAKAVQEKMTQRSVVNHTLSFAPPSQPPIVSRTSSSSQSSQGLDAAPTSVSIRRKSGANVLSSFFRRGSKVAA